MRIARLLLLAAAGAVSGCQTGAFAPIEIDLSKRAPAATPLPTATAVPSPSPQGAAPEPPAPAPAHMAPAAPSATPMPSPFGAAAPSSASTIESVVDAQNEAFNRHDLDALSSLYAADAVLSEYPNHIRHSGLEEIRRSYAKGFAESPALKVIVTRRLVQGDYLFDQETISGLPKDASISLVAIYEVRDGRIRRVWYVK